MSNGAFATSTENRRETKREELLCPPLRTSAMFGPRLEHVQKKLLDFFDKDMLHLFAFDIWHRPGQAHYPACSEPSENPGVGHLR